MLKACFSPADIGLDGILVLPSFFLFFYFWLFFTRSDLCSSFFQLVGDLSELRDKKYGDVNGKVIVMNDEFGNLLILMNMIYDDDVNRNVQWKFLTFVIHMCNLVIIMFWMRRILEKKFWSDLSCCQDLGDELWVLLKSNFDWIVARTIEKFSFLPPGSCKWEGSDQRNGKRVSLIKKSTMMAMIKWWW